MLQAELETRDFMVSKDFIIGIDLGGTKVMITVAQMNRASRLFCEVGSIRFPTKAELGGRFVLHRLICKTRSILKKYQIPLEKVEAITLGTPSIVHPNDYSTSHCENIPGWDELPLYSHLQDCFPTSKVFLENDANLAVLAELYEGAGIDHDSFLLVSTGTGIGCGVVINRTLYKGLRGSAGEIGVMWLPDTASTSDLQGENSFETMVSGAALCRRLGDASRIELTFRQYLETQEPGYSIIQRWLLALKMGILNAVSVLAPEAVILGGGVITANPWVCSPIQAFLNDYVYSPPIVKLAVLGDRATVRGALRMSAGSMIVSRV